MWAADDDEWGANFVEACVSVISPNSSVMTGFTTIFRARGFSQENPMPKLVPSENPFENVKQFFSCIQPTLFYGLHPTRAIEFFLRGPVFDFYDCYFVLRLILETNFRTIDRVLYGAGVDAANYEVKYASGSDGKKKLKFFPFFYHSAIALIRCSRLSVGERSSLIMQLGRLVLGLRRHHSGSKA